jgi:preprotein translocase subunit SecE
MVERQTPNLRVGGSNPSWPAKNAGICNSNGSVMKDIVQFLGEVRTELNKVEWPKYDDWVGSTIIVLILVVIFALYLGLIDFGFAKIASFIFKSYGSF